MPKWFDKLKKELTESIGESRKAKKSKNRYSNVGPGTSKDEASKELDKEFNGKQMAGGDEYEKE